MVSAESFLGDHTLSMFIPTSEFCLLKIGTLHCVFIPILANACAVDKIRKHRKKAIVVGL